jgi:hypothetical protein
MCADLSSLQGAAATADGVTWVKYLDGILLSSHGEINFCMEFIYERHLLGSFDVGL